MRDDITPIRVHIGPVQPDGQEPWQTLLLLDDDTLITWYTDERPEGVPERGNWLPGRLAWPIWKAIGQELDTWITGLAATPAGAAYMDKVTHIATEASTDLWEAGLADVMPQQERDHNDEELVLLTFPGGQLAIDRAFMQYLMTERVRALTPAVPRLDDLLVGSDAGITYSLHPPAWAYGDPIHVDGIPGDYQVYASSPSVDWIERARSIVDRYPAGALVTMTEATLNEAERALTPRYPLHKLVARHALGLINNPDWRYVPLATFAREDGTTWGGIAPSELTEVGETTTIKPPEAERGPVTCTVTGFYAIRPDVDQAVAANRETDSVDEHVAWHYGIAPVPPRPTYVAYDPITATWITGAYDLLDLRYILDRHYANHHLYT